MKKYILLNILLLSILFPVTARGHDGKGRSLNILYTGSLDGELEPCGCSPKTDFGGLARLSGYISKNRKALSPYLLIDAGNFSGADTPQGRLKTETLLKAYGFIGYDAVAFRKRETALQNGFLSQVSRQNRIKVVSDSPNLTRSVAASRNKLNINIGTNPEKSEKGKINILLTDIPVADVQLITGWDVIILSSGEALEEPLKENGMIIVSGYPKGKKLGLLTLHFDNKGKITGFKHRWQPLGNDIKEDQKVRQVLNDYDSQVAGLMKETERPLKETAYLGVAECAKCHQPFIDTWKKTGHAKALLSLEKTGKSSDPECLVCHTVGFGEDGGFYSVATTPELANVQCEVCHGTGKDHIMDFSKPMTPVTEYVCMRCHTKDKSPDFSYKDYLEKIKHW